MKQKIIKTIVMELNSIYHRNNTTRVKELNKVMRFVKSCDYFKGKKRELYKIIIDAKNKNN